MLCKERMDRQHDKKKTIVHELSKFVPHIELIVEEDVNQANWRPSENPWAQIWKNTKDYIYFALLIFKDIAKNLEKGP